jgi:aspartyl-tRNA(Asn)/glutamyl-tRNA(Gln) amidotransferase subunit A
VRIPAAWNDLVGLKTTHGLLSTQGTVPLCDSFDTVGPLARSVEDCALLLSLLAGTAPADLTGANLSGARLGVLQTTALDDLRPATARAFETALPCLSAAGAQIIPFSAPEVAEALTLAAVLFPAEAYAIWGPLIEAAPHKMFPRILDRFRSGGQVPATAYIAARRRLIELRAIYNERTSGFDGVLLPTSAILPPNAKRLMTDDAYYVSENLLALRNTRIGNLMDQCVLTLPTGHASCGLSLMSAPRTEARLLRLGQAAERALS